VDEGLIKQLLSDQLTLAKAASRVLEESRDRVGAALQSTRDGTALSIGQRESCEALTSRFARLCDLLVQRLFRTLDRVELADDGTMLDRLDRAEKRGIIASAVQWRELRELKNEIAHDYLIESSDRVLLDALRRAPELLEAVHKLEAYVRSKQYL
jgi:hypothetical protein